jgi:tripartite-type tricarboxylate transporter receptor subunit TctC
MNCRRRLVVALLSGAIAAVPLLSEAQSFPAPRKQIRIVVPFPPGGQADFQARIVAPKLAEALGVTVVVDNKPGASSIIGVQEVARAEPDGYTLLYTIASPMVVNPHVFAKLPYDALRDFAPVTLTAITAQALVAHVSVPARNVRELVAYAKANPGKLNFGSYGLGTSSHLYGEMFKASAGIDIVHIPYKGAGDATKDLVAGRVELGFMALTAALPHMQAGSLKVLGIVGEKRISSMPEAPTFLEQGVTGLEVTGWLGMFAPAKVPAPVVERLNAEMVRILRQPDIVERFRTGGSDAGGSTPLEFAALVRRDHAKWGEVVRRLGISLD